MPKKASDDLACEGDEKQTTEKGLRIPVPEREDFLGNLGKAAPTVPPEESGGESSPKNPSGNEVFGTVQAAAYREESG